MLKSPNHHLYMVLLTQTHEQLQELRVLTRKALVLVRGSAIEMNGHDHM